MVEFPPASAIFFWLVAGLTALCAVAVVVTQNIVRAAAWLLFTLAGTAGIYFLLGADFIGATQVIVYVGGVLVLVIFGVMLTAQGPFITMRASPAEWAISLLAGLLFLALLVVTLFAEPWPTNKPGENNPATSPATLVLGEAFLGVSDAVPPANLTGVPATVKDPLTGAPIVVPPVPRKAVSYLLPFEIVSVHLLVVLIGAAYLARAKRRRGAM